MKLTFVLLTACLLNASAKGVSQNVTFSGQNVPLKTAFASVEKQTGFLFFYAEPVLKSSKPVTINAENIPLEQFLSEIFKMQPLQYEIKDKNIIISAKSVAGSSDRQPTSGTDVFSLADTLINVRGRVVNETGEPVEGVTVTIKGAKTATTTNKNGEFSLSSIDADAVLVFTHISLETFELNVSGKTELAISLKTKVSGLGDVVVTVSTGYQDIPKERATGSFVKVNNELINRSVSTNILDRLIGVTSGLNYEPRDASVPNKSVYSIRGISSINANLKPLIIVDGFPYEENTAGGVITNINPNDIESITILKDAAAASIWGIKAGNGVIVITTKKGSFRQKAKIQINSIITIGQKPDIAYIPTISASDEIEFEKSLFASGYYNIYDQRASINYFNVPLPIAAEILLAQRKGTITAAQAEDQIFELKKHDVRTDINRHLLQKSVNQQYAINLTGGSEKFKYYTSIGYDKNRYTTQRDQYNRLTIRFDNTYVPIRNMEISTYLVYTQNNYKLNSLSLSTVLPTGVAARFSAYTQFQDKNGESAAVPNIMRLPYIDSASYPALLDWHYRPLDEMKYADNSNKQFYMRYGGAIKYSFIPVLSVELKAQNEKGIINARNFYSQQTFLARDLINRYTYYKPTGELVRPVPLGGILDLNNTELNNWNIRAQVNFNKSWTLHNVVALWGAESRESKMDNYYIRRFGYDPNVNTFYSQIDFLASYPINPRPYRGQSTIADPSRASGTVNRYLSYYGNGAYAFKNKYTFSISGRLDKSNFFGVKANQRRVPLWSAGISWDLLKEKFIRINALSNLKLRATYGYNGNTNNSATSFATAQYSTGPLLAGLNLAPQCAYIVAPPNPQLRWEKVKIVNIGLDITSENRQIEGSIEYYKKNGIDLIGPVTTEPTTGNTSYTGNIASIKGNGLDLTINTHNVDGRFKWFSSFLFSYATDEVTQYLTKGITAFDYASKFSGQMPFVGRPLFSLYSYKWAGLDPRTGDPRGYLADTITNFNNVISYSTPNDLVYSGPSTPQIFGSFRNTLQYSNFSVSFNLIYKFRYYYRRNSLSYSNLYNNWGGHSDYALRWQKSGDELNTSVPSLPQNSSATRDYMYLFSEATIEKGDHIRLQDVRLSYDLDKTKNKSLPFKNAQLYVYLNNLGIIWRANKKGIDPDYGDGFSGFLKPSRTYAIGVSANF